MQMIEVFMSIVCSYTKSYSFPTEQTNINRELFLKHYEPSHEIMALFVLRKLIF